MSVQLEHTGTTRYGRIPRPPAATSGHAVLDLVAHARSCLGEAAAATTAPERFAAAHLGALRAAAAMLAAQAQPIGTGRQPARRRSRGPRNVWDVLPGVAPELAEWAVFFGVNAGKRTAAQAGVRGIVTAREADDLLRDAETFIGLVCALLGLPHSPIGEPLAGMESH